LAGVAAALAVSASYASPPSTKGNRPLQPTEELELRMLTGMVGDGDREAKTRQDAAELLLTRTYAQATEALRAFLADSANRPAQIAVAEAVARHGGGASEFIEPLIAMLTGAEASVREPAARALMTYRNDGVMEKLLGVARDAKAEKAVRLVAISSLRWLLDKRAVDALVTLLDDRDVEIRAAAAETLARMTNIRAFATSAKKWRQWWDQNKNKPATEWLADLADSLGREKTRLETENSALRRRLAAAMTDLYAATPAAEQERLLLSLLKDPLADVRVVGVRLADKRVFAGGKVGLELRGQVRALLADSETDVRGAAAALAAASGDAPAVPVIVAQLKTEEVAAVKQSLLTALGQFADPNTVDPIMGEVCSKYEAVAVAATEALARVAARNPLAGKVRDEAVKTLLKCHGQGGNGESAALREALLTAMGTLADKPFLPALRRGLKDPAATVRLAAVKGVAKYHDADLADAIVPLAGDEDRGVRQAVVEALEALGGIKQTQTVLQRTDPAAEPDAGVRQKAWTVLMAMLAAGASGSLEEVCDMLADRKDAVAERIKIRQMLVAALKAEKSVKLPAAQRKLAATLTAAGRAADAAPLLGEVYSLHAASKNPDVKAVWLEWVDAMLQAGDLGVFKAIADAKAEAPAEGLKHFIAFLASLMSDGRHSTAVLLAGEGLRQLNGKLDAEQKQAVLAVLEEARTRQATEDRHRVAKLAAQLYATDAAARAAAVGELKAMGDRAARPLVLELQKLAGSAKPNTDAEKAVLEVLPQVAPKLTNYDVKAPTAERLQKIEEWLKLL
jgi:HEAT repeat protein